MEISFLTVNPHVVFLPEPINQGVQNGDDKDKAKHLDVDEESVGAQEGKINPVHSISSLLEKMWYAEQELLLPAHALAVEVQLPGVVQG